MRSTLCALASLAALACGPGLDREETLTRLRSAIDAEIESREQLQEHNALVVQIVDFGVLEGMRRFEVTDALGPGRSCGRDPLCAAREFRPSDLIFDVGRRDGMASGPILIVGFDRRDVLVRSYYLVRR